MMGDFERIFGAGANIDAIISSLAASHEREYRDDAGEETIPQSGRDLPKARTQFDVTGQVWRASATPCSKLNDTQLLECDLRAKQVLSAIEADPLYAFLRQEGNQSFEAAKNFLSHLRLGLDKIERSLDHLEAFVAIVVRGSSIPIVFARDNGPDAGYVSPTLSTHILALPNDIQLLRCGDLTLDGPFWNLPDQQDCRLGTYSYLAFAHEGPGRKVIEVSRPLLIDDNDIGSVSGWVEQNRAYAEKNILYNEDKNLSRSPGYEQVAEFVAEREPNCRTWSDAAEDNLRVRVRLMIACLVPPGATARAILNPTPSGSTLSCEIVERSLGSSGVRAAPDDPWWFSASDLAQAIIDLMPLPGFRGKSPSLLLFEDSSFSAQERLQGRQSLLDFLNETGIDTSAAADALHPGDLFRLFCVIAPEAAETWL